MKRILDSIDSPDSLKLLTDEELAILAHEIRTEIVQVTSKNGGHVASSLGAVEIILAVHCLINSPTDRFLFDVGHQSYAHKLITGRRDAFSTLRQYKGISGFPKPAESVYDVHPSGHASDSLSVACGIARARDLAGGNEKVVALIGDAALAGGMAFEALNDIGQAQTRMVIILNDNEMSISRNVGALAKHLGDVRVSSGYKKSRDSIQEIMENQMGLAGRAMAKLGKGAKESLKQFILPEAMLFEQLGIVCTPPVDGHNIPLLKRTLKSALDSDGPVLVHVVTKKGAGYAPAVANPSKFHGVGPYDVSSGELLKKSSSVPTYTQAFTAALSKEMEADGSIVALTAAMIDGTGLRPIATKWPARVFDVGIAEEHAVGTAAGFAVGGAKPVMCLYSTFLQRAIDQAIIDVSLAGANVVFAIDRAGLVGDDGPTHHGVFDMAQLRSIPGMRALAPSDEAELAAALHTALTLEGPVALRYPRGQAAGAVVPESPALLPVGESRCVREGSDAGILAFGRMVGNALQAAELLADEGIDARVVDMRWICPLDEQAILDAAETGAVVTVEEGMLEGGVGQGVLGVLAQNNCMVHVRTLGISSFVEQGNVEQLFADLGLDAQGIAEAVRSALA